MADQPKKQATLEEPGLAGGSLFELASAMGERARHSAVVAQGMTRRAHAMAEEDRLCRLRTAEMREDLAAGRPARSATNAHRSNAVLLSETLRCAGCGFPLMLGEDPEACHRCRDANNEQAGMDWEVAQSRWSLATDTAELAQDARDFAEASGARELPHDLKADAEFEQSEVEWEQAQTAWQEAGEARTARSRRNPASD